MLNEWQPIETAPNDGRPLRIYDPELVNGEFGSSWDGHWADVREDGSAGWVAGVWCNSHDQWETTNAAPTHWQALPDPPDRATLKESSNAK